jgi:hypothetical protein
MLTNMAEDNTSFLKTSFPHLSHRDAFGKHWHIGPPSPRTHRDPFGTSAGEAHWHICPFAHMSHRDAFGTHLHIVTFANLHICKFANLPVYLNNSGASSLRQTLQVSQVCPPTLSKLVYFIPRSSSPFSSFLVLS